jgi:hypothetical protein
MGGTSLTDWQNIAAGKLPKLPAVPPPAVVSGPPGAGAPSAMPTDLTQQQAQDYVGNLASTALSQSQTNLNLWAQTIPDNPAGPSIDCTDGLTFWTNPNPCWQPYLPWIIGGGLVVLFVVVKALK